MQYPCDIFPLWHHEYSDSAIGTAVPSGTGPISKVEGNPNDNTFGVDADTYSSNDLLVDVKSYI